MRVDRDDMIDKISKVRAVDDWQNAAIVDDVLIPALTEYLEAPYQAQVATVVDTTVAKWIAANQRQIAIINRLQGINHELRLTVRHLEEAVVDPGD